MAEKSRFLSGKSPAARLIAWHTGKKNGPPRWKEMALGAGALLVMQGTSFAAAPAAPAAPSLPSSYYSSIPVPASIVGPASFERDVARKAAWLPQVIKNEGVSTAYQKRFALFPENVQQTLTKQEIPAWMIALVSPAIEHRDEINQAILATASLAGQPPANKYAARFEVLLEFMAAAQMPTPGDVNTGIGLGNEGCARAMALYGIGPMKQKFPELAVLDDRLVNSQSTAQMLSLFKKEESTGYIQVTSVPVAQLTRENFGPGMLQFGHKPGGDHLEGWGRVPIASHWNPNDLQAVGNTGLKPFGDRLILQDYATSADSQEQLRTAPGALPPGFSRLSPKLQELWRIQKDHYNGYGSAADQHPHTGHGPITSHTPCTDFSGTENVYWCKQASFDFIAFRDPKLQGYGAVTQTARVVDPKSFGDVPLPRASVPMPR